MNSSYFFETSKVTEDCIDWIRQWFEQNGPHAKAIIGISGGKDSSVAAALCVKAIGKHRVLGVLMPQGTQHDIDASHRLCEHLEIDSVVINIGDSVHLIQNTVRTSMRQDLSVQSIVNLPARIRMSVLYAVSQTVGGRVVNTCNLSEDWVGYSTRYGDSAGDFSPLGSLTVTEVKQIGAYLGLPDDLVSKTPEDGLSGKSDEENLGFSYAELDTYIRTGAIENLEHQHKIDALHQKNLFKTKPMPVFSYGAKL